MNVIFEGIFSDSEKEKILNFIKNDNELKNIDQFLRNRDITITLKKNVYIVSKIGK